MLLFIYVDESLCQDGAFLSEIYLLFFYILRPLVIPNRASLFLVDSKTDELYSHVFDRGENESYAVHIFFYKQPLFLAEPGRA